MLKKLLLILLVILDSVAGAQNRYVVKFTDKNNTPYSISSPQSFLSLRAINRRAAQNIPITQSDLPVDPAYVQQVAGVAGVNVLNSSKWFNTVTIEVTSPTALAAVNALPFVVNSLNVGRQPLGMPTVNKFNIEGPVNESVSPALRTAVFNYGNAFNQTQMISINELHDSGYSGQNMVIAVIDAGFQDADLMDCFDSLFLQGRLLSTWDFVDHETNVFNDNWHGAAVLSTMTANIPGDMVGTAPDAQYILLRSEDATSEYIIEEYNWASAAEYADSAGADVINSSLGYTEFDDPAQNHVYADMDGNTAPATIAADLAASKGILVVNSAGNSGNSFWQYIGAPADGDSVFAIGAVDANGFYASFSSQGPSADGRIKPDVAAQGAGTSVFAPTSPFSIQSNGTSFSSPIIAGAVACLWQVFPSKKNTDIMQAVRMSASQFSSPDQFLGYGIPDFGVASLVLGGYEPSLFNNGLAVIDFYPNPVRRNEPLTYRFFSRNKGAMDVKVFDATGKLIYHRNFTPDNSIVTVPVITDLQAGMYFISVTSGDENVLKKMIVY